MKKYAALFLAGVMAFSAAGCGAGVEEITESSTELNIYMWQDYISKDVIKAFEEEYSCTVHLTDMNSTTEAVEKLTAGCGDTFDLVMVQNMDMGYLAEGEYVEKIKTDKLPNTSALKDYCWVSKSYGIPYLMKYIYVVYDAKKCPVEIKDYSDLLSPELQGKVASVDGGRNLFSMALTALGYDPNSTEDSELKAAYDWLVKFDQNVAVYDADAKALTEDGIVAAVTDDRTAAEVMAKKKAWKVAPFEKQKVQVLVDTFVIPVGAAHQDLAETFLNYICDPEVMAKNLEEMPYSCPNEVAEVLADEVYREAPERDFAYQKNVFLQRTLEDGTEVIDGYYQKLKAERPSETE
ncbi:MAG: spermidine/putrescine ABC transporter substrate-binding protein [Anaerotignum sp.]|nr:spermidine/putrescine ABC transporter substrate-binding protein [Anaerotignum sp.]